MAGPGGVFCVCPRVMSSALLLVEPPIGKAAVVSVSVGQRNPWIMEQLQQLIISLNIIYFMYCEREKTKRCSESFWLTQLYYTKFKCL